MSNIFDILAKINNASEELCTANNELKNVLFPIIEAMGTGSMQHETIVDCYQSGSYMCVTTEWLSYNHRDTDDYKIPMDIINAVDPLEAAKAYKADKEQQKIELNRVKTLAEIARLQKSLE